MGSTGIHLCKRTTLVTWDTCHTVAALGQKKGHPPGHMTSPLIPQQERLKDSFAMPSVLFLLYSNPSEASFFFHFSSTSNTQALKDPPRLEADPLFGSSVQTLPLQPKLSAVAQTATNTIFSAL